MEQTPSFRPPKRRKFTRRHSSSDDEIAQPGTQTVNEDGGFAAEKPSLSVAEIKKMRNQNRSRVAGVSFSNPRSTSADDLLEVNALSVIDHKSDKLKAMSDRFVGHSDLVVDVDKHMFISPHFCSLLSDPDGDIC